MKLAIFTSNAIRHKYLANALGQNAEQVLVISECRPNNNSDQEADPDQSLSKIEKHFALRQKTELDYFPDNHSFRVPVVPILYKEANSQYIYSIVKEFNPDLMIVFGSSIIREPLLSLAPSGRFLNLHLGLSPYYRGSGTNFWPFVNEELEYVGSTILHIDAGIDTGDILCHVRPEIKMGDNVHTVGCKVIISSAAALIKIMHTVKSDAELPRVSQWEVPNSRYYRGRDVNEEILSRYQANLENGLIEKFIKNVKKVDLKLIDLNLKDT